MVDRIDPHRHRRRPGMVNLGRRHLGRIRKPARCMQTGLVMKKGNDMKLNRQQVEATRLAVDRGLINSDHLKNGDLWVTDVSEAGTVTIKVNSRPLAVRVALNVFPELRGILGSEFQFDAKFDPKL